MRTNNNLGPRNYLKNLKFFFDLWISWLAKLAGPRVTYWSQGHTLDIVVESVGSLSRSETSSSPTPTLLSPNPALSTDSLPPLDPVDNRNTKTPLQTAESSTQTPPLGRLLKIKALSLNTTNFPVSSLLLISVFPEKFQTLADIMPFLEPDPKCLRELLADEIHRMAMKRRFVTEYKNSSLG